jgi:AcrR family transcriptional regulator
MPPTPRKSRRSRSRRPVQDRSRLTVESIRKAALQILERQGVRGLTTRAIAERAGVGVASLYRYFPNREAIVAEVIRGEILSYLDAEDLQRQLALLKGGPKAWNDFRRLPLAERLRFHIDGVVRANRALIKRFGPEFQARYRDQMREALGISLRDGPRVMWFGVADCADQMQLADLRLAAPILWAIVAHLLPLLVSFAESEDLSTEALVDEVLGLLLRYLGADREPV